MSTLTERAARIAADLRSALEPWAYPSTRREMIATARSQLAIAITEERTGVSHNEARLITIYSRAVLSPSQVSNSVLFTETLLDVYRELDTDLAGLLTIAETYAGERAPVAA